MIDLILIIQISDSKLHLVVLQWLSTLSSIILIHNTVNFDFKIRATGQACVIRILTLAIIAWNGSFVLIKTAFIR